MRFVTSLILCLAAVTWADYTLAQEEPESNAELNPVVIKVNQAEVHAVEITLAAKSIERQLIADGTRENASTEQILEVATQQVIEQKLLAQEARRFGITPDESRIKGMLQFAVRQAGGEENLAKTLAQGGSSIEQLEGIYRERDLARSFINEQLRPTVTVKDPEVEAFYNEHKRVFVTEEQVHARHIVVEVGENPDAEVERAAYERALQLRARALSGEDFAKLARQYSKAKDAESGGDLGFFTRRGVLKAISDVAFDLEPGQISTAIRTPFGYHIVKVEERRPETQLSLDQVRDDARSLLINERTADMVAELLETLWSSAKIEYLDESLVRVKKPEESESPQ
jgi:peptidyl-prolyl cis-trans isomerase C